MFTIYQVLPGENLEVIADKFGTTVDYLVEINGDILTVPGSSIIVPKYNKDFVWYTVKKGDSIYAIASKYDIDYKDILAVNGLKENDYIYPNQVIMIPKNNVNYYITRNGDTLDLVSSMMSSSVDELVRQNESIYLIPDQFLVYKKEENM